MERTIDAIADELGLDRAEVRLRNFITPDEMPYDHHLTFQDGRPLIYDSGDFPGSLRTLMELVGWDGALAEAAAARRDGRKVGVGIACYVEGTGVGPYEGAHVVVETSGKVKVGDRADHPGPGSLHVLRPDRRRRAGRAVRGRRGGHRRHPAVRLRRGHLRLPRAPS
jgi:carbon-monoxide dehydrogenase large subunit